MLLRRAGTRCASIRVSRRRGVSGVGRYLGRVRVNRPVSLRHCGLEQSRHAPAAHGWAVASQVGTMSDANRSPSQSGFRCGDRGGAVRGCRSVLERDACEFRRWHPRAGRGAEQFQHAVPLSRVRHDALKNAEARQVRRVSAIALLHRHAGALCVAIACAAENGDHRVSSLASISTMTSPPAAGQIPAASAKPAAVALFRTEGTSFPAPAP